MKKDDVGSCWINESSYIHESNQFAGCVFVGIAVENSHGTPKLGVFPPFRFRVGIQGEGLPFLTYGCL